MSLDFATYVFILNVKFRKPMMNNLNFMIRISSQGFDRELAPLNFPCGLILFYSSPQSGKPTYLLITLLNSCKKCFISERSRTPNLLIRSQTLYPIELRAHTVKLHLRYKYKIFNPLSNLAILKRFKKSLNSLLTTCFTLTIIRRYYVYL